MGQLSQEKKQRFFHLSIIANPIREGYDVKHSTDNQSRMPMKSFAAALIRWEWLVLILLVPILALSGTYQVLLLSVIPMLWIARKVASAHFIPPTPYDLALLLLLLTIALSFVVTFDTWLSVPKIGVILFGIAIFYGSVSYSQQRPNGLWYILGFVLALGAIISIVGLVGGQWLPPFELLNRPREMLPPLLQTIPGAVGGVINSNQLAGTLCWIAPLALAILIGYGQVLWIRNRILFMLLSLTAFLTTFVLLATLSRGGILGFSSGLALVMILFMKPQWRLVLIVALVVIATGLFLFYQFPQGAQTDVVGDTLGLASRIELWNRALLTVSDFPLTGLSVNGFRQVVHGLYPLFVVSPEIDVAHAHNHLLQAAVDLGIPGLIAYLAIWFVSGALLFKTWRVLKKRRHSHLPYAAVVAGLSGSLLAGWIFGVFDAVALGARPAFIWWLLIGMTASTYKRFLFKEKRAMQREGSPGPELDSVNPESPGTPAYASSEWLPRAEAPLPSSSSGRYGIPERSSGNE